jgi:hypothetical protein
MFDICATRDTKDKQNEVDSDFIATQLKAGNPRSREMFNAYLDTIKLKDNYPATAQPFLTDSAKLMSALHCKDPDDVSILTPPADVAAGKPIEFSIDYWRADTNQIFDYVKAQKTLTPTLIKDVNQSLNTVIPTQDRRDAEAAFNERASAQNLPLEVAIDGHGKLRLQSKDGKLTASW